MLAIERRNVILSKLAQDGKVIVADLSRDFGVTEETIRRDLEKLDKDGLAKKTYGGAVATQTMNTDLPFSVRKRANVDRKQRIAQMIGDMIHSMKYMSMFSIITMTIFIYVSAFNHATKSVFIIQEI